MSIKSFINNQFIENSCFYMKSPHYIVHIGFEFTIFLQQPHPPRIVATTAISRHAFSVLARYYPLRLRLNFQAPKGAA